jgi:hypothetical protein
LGQIHFAFTHRKELLRAIHKTWDAIDSATHPDNAIWEDMIGDFASNHQVNPNNLFFN